MNTQPNHHLDPAPGPDTRRVWKLFWAWQDEQEEAWLAEKAAQGWHLKHTVLPGWYTFVRGEQRRVIYRLDFKFGGQDWPEYLQLFEDLGWRQVCRTGSWVYFRREATAEGPDAIYTDESSKVRKYLGAFSVHAVLLFALVIVLSPPEFDGSWLRFAVFGAWTAAILGLVYGTVRLLCRIQDLSRR